MKIMNFITLLGLLLIFVISSFSAQAAIVNNLYQGEVQVAGQTPADWQKAIPLALKQVLVKLTGNQQIDQIDAVSKAMTKAQSYVQSYNYLTIPAADPAAASTLNIQIRFSPKAVRRIVAQANQNILPNNRPAILVWLVTPDANNQPQLLVDPSNSMVSSLQKQAEMRAFPLVWPKLDSQDLTAFSAAQAWALNINQLKLASDRYHPEKILLGKLQKAGNGWQANWVFIDNSNGQAPIGQTQGADAGLAAASGFDFMDKQTVAQMPSPAAAPTPLPNATNEASLPEKPQNIVTTEDSAVTPSTGIILKVDGIHGLDDYAALLNYLRSLSSVASVDTEEMNDDNIVLSIQVNGTSDMLAKDIAVGKKLQPAKDTLDHDVWDYHWTGVEEALPSTSETTDSQTTSAPAAVPAVPMPNTSVAQPLAPAPVAPAAPMEQRPSTVQPSQPSSDSGTVYTTPPTPAESYPINDQPQSFKSESDDQQAE